MAIKIDFLADVAKFLRGTKDVAGALDDVAGDLENLGRDSEQSADRAGDALGDAFQDGSRQASQDVDRLADDLDSLGKDGERSAERAGDALGDAFQDGTKDAGQQVDRLEDRVSAAFRAMADDAQQGGRQIGNSTSDGARQASEGLQDLGAEGRMEAEALTSSFDGSAESIGESMQALASVAFGGFGPAGMAAGLLAAAGIGVAMSSMQKSAEEATAAKERVVSLVEAIAEAGGDITQVDVAGIITEWGREVNEDNWISKWTNEAETNFEKYADLATEAGVKSGDAMRGMKGSAEDSQGFLDGTTAEWERLGEVIIEGTTVGARGGVMMTQAAKDAQTQQSALSELRDGAQENLDTQKNAIEVYNIETDAVGAAADETERAADAVRDKADANREAAGATMDAVTADLNWRTSLIELSGDIAHNGRNLDLNTEAGRANAETLVDLAENANSLIAARVAEGGSTADVTAQAQGLREEYVRQAIAAGHSQESAEALATSYGLIPENVSTMVQAQGTEEAAAAVDAAAEDKDANVNVTTNGTEAGAQAGVDAVQGKDAPVNVTTNGTEAGAQAGVDAVQGKDAPVDVTTEGTDGATQDRIDRIKGKEIKIDVDDEYTVKHVQDRINGIRGKDVTVRVVGDFAQFDRDLANRLQARSMDVTVNERRGTQVNP